MWRHKYSKPKSYHCAEELNCLWDERISKGKWAKFWYATDMVPIPGTHTTMHGLLKIYIICQCRNARDDNWLLYASAHTHALYWANSNPIASHKCISLSPDHVPGICWVISRIYPTPKMQPMSTVWLRMQLPTIKTDNIQSSSWYNFIMFAWYV